MATPNRTIYNMIVFLGESIWCLADSTIFFFFSFLIWWWGFSVLFNQTGLIPHAHSQNPNMRTCTRQVWSDLLSINSTTVPRKPRSVYHLLSKNSGCETWRAFRHFRSWCTHMRARFFFDLESSWNRFHNFRINFKKVHHNASSLFLSFPLHHVLNFTLHDWTY